MALLKLFGCAENYYQRQISSFKGALFSFVYVYVLKTNRLIFEISTVREN